MCIQNHILKIERPSTPHSAVIWLILWDVRCTMHIDVHQAFVIDLEPKSFPIRVRCSILHPFCLVHVFTHVRGIGHVKRIKDWSQFCVLSSYRHTNFGTSSWHRLLYEFLGRRSPEVLLTPRAGAFLHCPLTSDPLGYFYNAPQWGGGYFEPPPLWSPKLLDRF